MVADKIEVLCLGEVLIDFIALEKDLTTFKRFFGGSPANVAMNLSKLGHRTAFAGSVGSDFLGDYIIKLFESNSVDISLLNRKSSVPTSIVFINEFVDPPIPIFYKNADIFYTYSSDLEKMIEQVEIIHVSAHSLSFNPMRETILKAMKYASKLGKLISYEPNFRSIINLKDAQFLKSVFESFKYVNFIKPSLDDAREIFGDEFKPKELINKFQHYSIKNSIILTCGAKGVYFLNEDNEIQFKDIIPVNKIAGVTGAGDAFWSGFLSSILKKKTLTEAIKLGIDLAAIKMSHKGAIS